MLSGLVGQHPANYLQVGFPSGWVEHLWTLEFKQSSLYHLSQVLRNRQDIASFVSVPLSSPAMCPFGLSVHFRLGRRLLGDSWELPQTLYEGHLLLP
jgi:hypothetical protein